MTDLEKLQHVNREKKLVNELRELIAIHERLDMSYKEYDVTIVNPMYISQKEKDSIYHLWSFTKEHKDFTDADLKALVLKDRRFARYILISKNFPHLIEHLRESGLDSTIQFCAKQRKIVKDLREQMKSSLLLTKNANKENIDTNTLIEKAYLHALFVYSVRTNVKLTDEEFVRLVEEFPEHLGLYADMIKRCPKLIETLRTDGLNYVSMNIFKLEERMEEIPWIYLD